MHAVRRLCCREVAYEHRLLSRPVAAILALFSEASDDAVIDVLVRLYDSSLHFPRSDGPGVVGAGVMECTPMSESLSMIHQHILTLGGPTKRSQLAYRQVESLTLVCVLVLRQHGDASDDSESQPDR